MHVQVKLTNTCEDSHRPIWRSKTTFELPPPYESILPAYAETANDLPPDYTCTETSASRQRVIPVEAPTTVDRKSPTTPCGIDISLPEPVSALREDFRCDHHVRQHANKKAKKAAQEAQRSKWADSGDEGEGAKEGGDGEQNGGDNGGDGAGGGAGGDGGGDGGDGGGDDWDFGGGKKNKKKGKKGQKEDEEEEARKKEEEAAAAVTGSFWGDDGGDAAGGDPADVANPDDEWGMASTGKKKKGKKGKVRLWRIML